MRPVRQNHDAVLVERPAFATPPVAVERQLCGERELDLWSHVTGYEIRRRLE